MCPNGKSLDICANTPIQCKSDANLENGIDAPNYSPLAPILTLSELAKYLQVSNATAYELVKQKGFPAFRVGNSIRINARSLDAWILQQTNAAQDMEEYQWQNARTVKETSRKEKMALGKHG